MTGINDEAFDPDREGSPDFNLKSRDVICEFIESTNTPFTIGIKGSWGSGKTSLLRMIKSKLDKTKGKIKFHQIWVNAWEHSIFKETKDTVTSLAYQISSDIEFKAYGKKRKVSEAGKLIGNFLSMGANAGAALFPKAK